jgi:hypothetical protein
MADAWMVALQTLDALRLKGLAEATVPSAALAKANGRLEAAQAKEAEGQAWKAKLTVVVRAMAAL